MESREENHAWGQDESLWLDLPEIPWSSEVWVFYFPLPSLPPRVISRKHSGGLTWSPGAGAQLRWRSQPSGEVMKEAGSAGRRLEVLGDWFATCTYRLCAHVTAERVDQMCPPPGGGNWASSRGLCPYPSNPHTPPRIEPLGHERFLAQDLVFMHERLSPCIIR